MSDFETMPIGTARLLRDVAENMRAEYQTLVETHGVITEQLTDATDDKREGLMRLNAEAERELDRWGNLIGRVEALLDRCPHAPPLEVEISAPPMPETDMLGPS